MTKFRRIFRIFFFLCSFNVELFAFTEQVRVAQNSLNSKIEEIRKNLQ